MKVDMHLKGAGVAVVTVVLIATALMQMINSTDIKATPHSRSVATSPLPSGKTREDTDWRKGNLGEDGTNSSSLNLSMLSADEVSLMIQEMQQDLMALHREVKRQRDELDALRRPEPDHASFDDATVETEKEYRHELENQRITDQLYQIDDIFMAESSDPSWSSEVELAVDTAVTNLHTKGADLLSLDCRTSICRLEVAYQEQTAQIEFETALSTELVEIAPGMTIDSDLTDDGYTSSVIYLMRSGYDSP